MLTNYLFFRRTGSVQTICNTIIRDIGSVLSVGCERISKVHKNKKGEFKKCN
jgi:hypothetical protein